MTNKTDNRVDELKSIDTVPETIKNNDIPIKELSNGIEQDLEQNLDNQNSMSTKVTDEQVINWIKSRRSIGNLHIPAPSKLQVKAAIECAITAPDHKKLKPWRFTIVEGQARHNMGRAFLDAAEAKAKRDGIELTSKTADKTLKMPLRAPMIITVATRIKYHEKVPPFEQMLSAGAAVQNLILALKAQGFSTVWRTGPLANEAAVKAYFNVGSEDYITAFVYAGSSHCDFPTREDSDISEYVTYND